ncbi:MAG: alpha/beta hydrolase [Bacteroidota bacterium]
MAKNYTSEVFHFNDNGDDVQAVINIPKHIDQKSSIPLVVFVHGDGEMSADNFGYYIPIWDHLAEHGIASMAWDKKGVGGSTGNWLDQSMPDRAQEVVSAIEAVRIHSNHSFSSIGLIGFSQAGWVLPKVPSISDSPDYMISVSGAINWKRQSNYLTRRRLEGLGKSDTDIAQGLAENEKTSILFEKPYAEYLAYVEAKCKELDKSDCSPMSRDRFRFVQKNTNADAIEDLKKVRCPVFGMFGKHDLNVDFQESFDTYQAILSETMPEDYQVKIYQNATHGLLQSDKFNAINLGFWMWLKMRLYGKRAFVDGVLDDITAFILANDQ